MASFVVSVIEVPLPDSVVGATGVVALVSGTGIKVTGEVALVPGAGVKVNG